MYLVLIIFISGLTWAHQTSLNSSGNELLWANSSVPMVIRTNTSDLNSSTVTNVILNSMAEWNASSSARINSVGASSNEIKFDSDFPYGNAVIGLTELSYNSAGAIHKATIILNDNFRFYGTPGNYATGGVFLGDVVTHELGHVFGLSHSEVLDSSMFYSSFEGQSTVSFDDKTGIRQKYDNHYGKISGIVKGGRSVGILGAHVQAISRKTGKSSGVVSDENGSFELDGLDLDDTYYLYSAPIKNASSLPGYFANVQAEFCPAAYVGSFFSKCGGEQEGKPQGISLTGAISSVDVGAITVNCGLKANGAYNYQKLQPSFSPLTIFNYDPASDKVEQAYVGWFRNQNVHTFSLSDIFKADFTHLSDSSLFVKFSLISYPLGTQLEYQIDLGNGQRDYVTNHHTLNPAQKTRPYTTDFEYFMPVSSDSSINMFTFKVRARKLGSSYASQTFPSYETFSSSTYLPYLIVVSLWEERMGVKVPVVSSEVNLSDNESCLDAPFAYSVSSSSDASDNNAIVSGEQAAAAAGCGTIGPPKSGPGSSMGLMTLGFMLSLIVSTLVKTRKKFLS